MTIIYQVKLIYKDAVSDKYYIVTIEQVNTNTFKLKKHWGRTGTSGQFQEAVYNTEISARRAAKRIINDKKQTKGYVEESSISLGPEAKKATPTKESKPKTVPTLKAWSGDDWDLL